MSKWKHKKPETGRPETGNRNRRQDDKAFLLLKWKAEIFIINPLLREKKTINVFL